MNQKKAHREKPGCYGLQLLDLLTCIIGTGCEIYCFAAFIAFMGFFKFIRENLLWCIAFRAIAGKGF